MSTDTNSVYQYIETLKRLKGTQNMDSSPFYEALDRVLDFAEDQVCQIEMREADDAEWEES